MNYVALRTMLEAEFGDSGTRFRTLLLKWANAVYHEICAAHDSWPWLQLVKSITQASGSDTYTPESASPALSVRRVLDMIDLTDTAHRELTFVGECQFWKQDQVKDLTGNPELFRIWANTIYFYPEPDSARTLQFRYIVREPDLNESDNAGLGTTILIPDQDIRVLEQGIHAKAYRWLDDARYAQAQADFLRNLADLKTQCSNKGPGVIYPSTGAGRMAKGDRYRVVVTP
jgi:hypothetical protein